MAEIASVSYNERSIDTAQPFEPYTRVVIHIDDEASVSYGDDRGRTMELENPFGTEDMARRILQRLGAWQYQPLYVTEGEVDPAAELGDGIDTGELYSGIFRQTSWFDRLALSDVSAPTEEEVDHEYEFVPPQERKFKRQLGNVRATLRLQADRITAEVEERTAQGEAFASQLQQTSREIAAKISATGGSQSSFGWSLTATGFKLFSSNKTVLSATASGIEVNGKITATSGVIGGFTIGDKSIYKNISKLGGTQNTGVYLGTDGIQVGQGFKVDNYGNLFAKNATLSGKLIIGGKEISAADLQKGAASAAANAGTWTNGAIGGNNYTKATTNGTSAYPGYMKVGKLDAVSGLSIFGYSVFRNIYTINGVQYKVWSWS